MDLLYRLILDKAVQSLFVFFNENDIALSGYLLWWHFFAILKR